MKDESPNLVDALAQVIFEVMRHHNCLKAPATIAVAAGLSGGPTRAVRRSVTVWQDYRPEARAVLKLRSA